MADRTAWILVHFLALVSHLSFQEHILESNFSRVLSHNFPDFKPFSKAIPRYLHGEVPFLNPIILQICCSISGEVFMKKISDLRALAFCPKASIYVLIMLLRERALEILFFPRRIVSLANY